MGGSARLICEAKGQRPLHLFDVFDTLQSPSGAGPSVLEQALRKHFKGTHGTIAQVRRLLAAYEAVRLHPGIFPDSVPDDVRDLKFSFVHLDMDIAESTRAGLEFFEPRLVQGGILIGDDYGDSAVRETFADYFQGRPDTSIELPWGQVMVVKQGAG